MESDAQLIYRVLSGDDEAFTALVRKHQKGVHALAWRKLGDFHLAEDITQDVFFQVYKKLSTLKNPNQFTGWLYVIANRLCKNWHLKNKAVVKSMEEVPVLEMQRMSYDRYLSEKNEKEGRERRHKIVKKLLEKLPESERTVVTLYYLGEMTAKEIGNFLGVSVNTITSRLHRARKRLKKEEELLVQEILGNVQLPNSLTEDIARKVSDTKLTLSPTGKPFLPWTAFGGAVVLVLLLLSASNQYLLRFQKPYSFEAESERTVEIIDAPVVLNSEAKPAGRNQAGRAAATNKNGGDGVQVSASVLASNAEHASVKFSESRWVQTSGPRGGSVFDIFATSEGTVYAFSQVGIYKLAANATTWLPVAIDVPTGTLQIPMAEHDGLLYLVSNDKVFASTDDGETWRAFCARPEGNAIGLVIVSETQQADRTIYLALENKGVFRFTDVGEQWTRLNDGLMGRTISKVAAVGNTVFAGTDNGLYRLDAGVGVWEQLLKDVSGSIYALAVSEDSLYVSTGPNFGMLQQIGSKPGKIAQAIHNDNSNLSRVFHSADLGMSWIEITPTNGARSIKSITGISLLVAGKTILAQAGTQFRSRDSGQTWVNLRFKMDSLIQNTFSSVAVSENTFYKTGILGIHRTTDGGESWHLFMDGMVGTGVLDLVEVNNRFYAHTNRDIIRSTDGGESWSPVRVNTNGVNPKLLNGKDSHPNFSGHSRLAIADNTLYVITPEREDLHVLRLSDDGKALIPIHGVPAFEVDVPSKNNRSAGQRHLSERLEKGDDWGDPLWSGEDEIIGTFAASGETFYMEYKRKLFRWRLGDPEWKDTGLVDTGEQPDNDLEYRFRLAVSGETLYAGKRDGRLFQSFDAGNSWRDITPNLPSQFTCFKEIVFARSTVYIATDSGVLASQTGEHWRVIADEVVIDRFAVNGTTIYGASDTGVYRLDIHDKWERISPGVPGQVLSLVVDRDKLYVATKHRGMFHISLEEKNYIVNN